MVCELLWVSAPSTIMALVHVLSRPDAGRPAGQGLLRALPRSYQVTPNIPDRRRATQQKEVRPLRPTASKRVSSPPVGTFSSASDDTDHPNQNSKPQRGRAAAPPTRPA